MPRALVAQRIEQKTSKFLTPRLHRTVYRVVGEKWWVVRFTRDEILPSSSVVERPRLVIVAQR
jgi:hypothetical protein